MDTTAEWPHKGILGLQVESNERQPQILQAAEIRRVIRPQKEHAINCPRCDSTNTKFCYYNNYSLSQPRYFCKTCRRYWTAGGTLRNVPVGGGSRKNKKSSSSAAHATKTSSSPTIPRPSQDPIHLAYKFCHGAGHDLNRTLAAPAQFVNPEPLSPEPGSLFGAGFGFRELIMGPAAASSMKMHPLSGVDGGDGRLLFPFEDLKHVSMINESDKAAVLHGDPTFFGMELWEMVVLVAMVEDHGSQEFMNNNVFSQD